MHSIAKATIIVPLIIILIASVLRFSRATYNLNTKSPIVPTSVINTPSPYISSGFTIDVTDGIQSLFLPDFSGKSIDLKGPYVCSVVDIEKEINVFIKDRQIYIKYKTSDNTNFILVKEDCIHKWVNMEKQGRKVCGIDQYLSMFDSLSSLPLFSTEVLFTLISKLESSSNQRINSEGVKKLVNSCENQDIDDAMFTFPTNITFIEEKFTQPPKELMDELK